MKQTIFIVTVLLLSGCHIYFQMDDILFQQEDISLTWKGDIQVSYDPLTCQFGFNDRRNEYRVYDDRLSFWFTMRCSEKPVSEEQVITADVTWTGASRDMEFKGIEFKVEKVDDSGLLWLWNSSNRIGIVIRNL